LGSSIRFRQLDGCREVTPCIFVPTREFEHSAVDAA